MKKHDLHNAGSLPAYLAFAGLSMAASLACTGVWAQATAGPSERPVGNPAGTVGAVAERPVSAAPAVAATAEKRDDSYMMKASKGSDSKVLRPGPTVRTSTASASAASATATKPAPAAASAAAAIAARPRASGVPSKPAQ